MNEQIRFARIRAIVRQAMAKIIEAKNAVHCFSAKVAINGDATWIPTYGG
jgi:hypothetical protein